MVIAMLFLQVSIASGAKQASEEPQTAKAIPASSFFDEAFSHACSRYGVPKTLALAIAHHESSMQPWALNVAGKSFFPATKEEALRITAVAIEQQRSFDVGLMQVNSWWLNKLQIAPEVAIIPRNNIMLGVWILAQEIQRHGFNWKAVGAYHSPTHSRQRRYAYSIAQHYQRLLQEQP